MIKKKGRVAQQGERRPYKPKVVGSNPALPTMRGGVVQIG